MSFGWGLTVRRLFYLLLLQGLRCVERAGAGVGFT